MKAIVRNELFLHQADSAKITLDTSETNEIRRAFVGMVANTWSGLNISPNRLADSAKTVAERERLAAARVDNYMDRLLTKDEQFVPVQPTLEAALHTQVRLQGERGGHRSRARARAASAHSGRLDASRAAAAVGCSAAGGQPGAPTPAPAAPTPAPDSTKKP